VSVAPTDKEIEITPEMIRAGASALLDGSELTRAFGTGDVEDYTLKVLRAALASRTVSFSEPKKTCRG
jgi:hypothetical protein